MLMMRVMPKKSAKTDDKNIEVARNVENWILVAIRWAIFIIS